MSQWHKIFSRRRWTRRAVYGKLPVPHSLYQEEHPDVAGSVFATQELSSANFRVFCKATLSSFFLGSQLHVKPDFITCAVLTLGISSLCSLAK